MNGHSHPEQPGALSFFWLNSLESLLNAFVELDPDNRQRFASLDGLVVRVKTFAPYQVFYLLFSPQRIEVSPQPQGEVRARLSGRVQDLVWTFLGLGSEERAEAKGNLNLWGDAETTTSLRMWLQEFNVRSAAGYWLRNHWPLNALWQKLSQQDLSWLQDLQPIPDLIRQTREEVLLLKGELTRQQQQLAELRTDLRNQLQYIRAIIVILLLVLGMGAGYILSLAFTH